MDYLEKGRRVLDIEILELQRLRERLDENFSRAVTLIKDCVEARGKIVVVGVGKSGHIGRKIASTLTSTGSPAVVLDSLDALHGDLGMVADGDVVLAFSASGETEELLRVLPAIARFQVQIIAICGDTNSSLAQNAHVVLDVNIEQEACPLNLAPTASTTAALALGDALAVALLDARGFSADDFARSHPRGRLPRQALVHVSDVMRKGEAVPQVRENASLKEALIEMSRARLGMTAVVDSAGRVRGIFTDGDLRRTLENTADIRAGRIADLMTPGAKTIAPKALAAEAVQLMEKHKINQMLVVDEEGALVGALNMHDLFRAKVI